ncbi:MAG: hypothetical protein KY466_06235 [Gemmatimonadetes bacterium]|nr:hypothetical protein [Gemmatimonadota bacterium]
MNKPTPGNPGSRRRAAPVHGGGDRYEALLEVLEQQAERASQDDLPRRPAVLRFEAILLVALALITVWVWVLPPAWLIPRAVPPVPIAEEEAGLRIGIYLQAQRIRAYELAHGVLPETLEEAGPAIPGMRYRVVSHGVYELTGTTERVRLSYRSTEPLREWVGTGAEIMTPERLP